MDETSKNIADTMLKQKRTNRKFKLVIVSFFFLIIGLVLCISIDDVDSRFFWIFAGAIVANTGAFLGVNMRIKTALTGGIFNGKTKNEV